MSTLRFTLHKKAFEVMVTGEKPDEFRKICDWMDSRLFDKSGKPRHYHTVEFTNGYGKDKPRFTAEFKGFDILDCVREKYSNGLTVEVPHSIYAIHLGKILSIENYAIPTVPTA